MPKPVCPKCCRFYRPKKNGTAFVEMMPKVGNAPAGLAAPDAWKPYKLWVGDLWHCLGCGGEIVIGALNPLNEHYRPDFDAAVKVAERLTRQALGRDLIRVNDC